MESLIAALTLVVVGYIAGSVKIINEGNEGIVERLGQYRRSLKPGLNFVIPVFDTVLVETTREQVLDTDPQQAITRDNVPLTVDAVMYWKILDVQTKDLERHEKLPFANPYPLIPHSSTLTNNRQSTRLEIQLP